MKTSMLAVAAAVAALAVPSLASAAPAPAPTIQSEKCYGVNAQGGNDCAATGSHSCAGEAKIARDPNSWIYVPVGTCQKIDGGSTTPKKV